MNKFSCSDPGCPSTLRVISKNLRWIEGQYEITNQKRRGQPVWYNEEKIMFLSVAKSNRWHIKPLKNYYDDDNLTFARSKAELPTQSGKVWCPQNLVYQVPAYGNWTSGFIKVLGKIHLDKHARFLTIMFCIKANSIMKRFS